ncbi:23S ribosomal RNA methyltransferase Erm [Salipaludibacillus agaradhaerens]|uniref:23S ribosomal RNA methyltransferase Erm n=1 Tax=Salipaludibacillus agaradhaerens TaxID=76935 RepID=UPI002151952F|nr:23S ribosomal RNA methyltransferase Erm [Salipaludibacillus agaradhaerens]MCR6105070.1 23S ribosomal RNA methyltransferase Erm [Salipaludibacillus agaradhaerens]MCR6117115.1 23S ribosomal RNA methyltransferase Erm [Salipaludibacillus agaradhaerens]
MRKHNKRNRKVRKCIEGPNFSGQHFMHHKPTIRQLIQLASIGSEDTVVDIGAGKGALTFPLSDRGCQVLAVEYDKALATYLKEKAKCYNNIHVFHQNILGFPLPKRPFKVVANIPYAITTEIMKKLLSDSASMLQNGVIVMEYGAAKRFTSFPQKNPDIILWRMWFDLKIIKRLPATYFSPPPSVSSAVLKIRRKTTPLISYKNGQHFHALVSYALAYPIQPLSRALSGIFTPRQVTHLVKTLNVSRETSINQLCEEQWKTVFETMSKHVDRRYWPSAKKKR